MVRIYLTGRVCLESEGRTIVAERQFRGKQTRLAFVYLVCRRFRPVTREEIADILWPEDRPPQWPVALSAIVSRLRKLLADPALGLDREPIHHGFGQYQLVLPQNAWVDIEAASCALDEAETAIRAESAAKAWAPGWVALSIYRRPFLSGEEGEWVESQRQSSQRALLRALDCFAAACLDSGEYGIAADTANEAITLDPFRESSYRHLLEAHAQTGDRAAGVHTYHRLRTLLLEELGTEPGALTEAAYLRLLG